MSRPTEWLASETELARANYHLPPAQFQRITGRTKQAARAHLKYISRADVRERKNAQKVALRLAMKQCQPTAAVAPIVVPDEVIAEAARRAAAPRSLTGIVMGDPPIGFSALERRS